MESQVKSVKRQRSENWLEEDKVILKELIKERVAVIENKNTDANTNSKKMAAWNDLSTSFNYMAHTPRTLQQIKAQWGIIKMTAKKKKCLERRQRLQTGGGPPPATDSLNSDDIAVWLPHEFTVDSNEFDSDSQLLTDKKSEEPKAIILDESPEQVIEMVLQPGAAQQIKMSTSSFLESCNETPTHNILATTSKPPDPPKTSTATINKLRASKNKQITKRSTDAALKLADAEIACRMELHELHMAIAKQKLKNLILKEEILKKQLNCDKNKNND